MLPEQLRIRMQELDKELEDDDITKKGYCKKKWALLRDHSDASSSELIQKLLVRSINDEFSENDRYKIIIELLDNLWVKLSAKSKEVNGNRGNTDPEAKDSGNETTDDLSLAVTPENTAANSDSEMVEVGGETKGQAEEVTGEKEVVSGDASTEETSVLKETPSADEKADNESTSAMESSTCAMDVQDEEHYPSPKQRRGKIPRSASNTPEFRRRSVRRTEGGIQPTISSMFGAVPSSSKCKGDAEEGSSVNDADCESASASDGSSMKRKSPIESDDSETESPTRVLRKRSQPDKKIKTEDDEGEFDRLKKVVKRMSVKMKQETGSTLERCKICRQNLNSPDLLKFEGHPHNAVDEFVALTNPKLTECYDTGDLPQNKLTCFSIYDENGHLCPLDGGIIEKNHNLRASGYIKAVFEDDPSVEGGIPAKELGPINQWWIGGYDGGDKALVGISTDSGEYILMEPSVEYKPLMEALWEKIYLGKLVIEYLIKEEAATFEDLLNHIQTTVPPPGIPKITEESLIRHSQFVCDQVVSYDEAGYSSDESDDEEDWRKLITVPCMQSLISLAGTTFSKRKSTIKGERSRLTKKRRAGDSLNKEKEGWSKSTTTSLVSDIFDTFFKDQLDTKDVALKGPKKLRCGVCEQCQQSDCGSCVYCRDMLKFGGSGKNKQSCILRKCPYMAVKEEEANYESDDDDEREVPVADPKSRARSLKAGKKKVVWVGEPLHVDSSENKKYYQKVMVDDEEICVGDFVSCEAYEKNSPVVIGRVQYLWESSAGQRFMHLYWFSRGCETVLGESADPQELFLVDQCESTHLNGVICKVTVHYIPTSPDWAIEGGKEVEHHDSAHENVFFYSKKYDELHGRFEDVPPEPENPQPNLDFKYCCSCIYSYNKMVFEVPSVTEPLEESADDGQMLYGQLTWRGEEFRKGNCVYLDAGTFKFPKGKKSRTAPKKDEDTISSVDETLYPEYYRKSLLKAGRASNETTPEPFCIGLIHAIAAKEGGVVEPDKVTLEVYKFYRPENTRGIISDLNQHDLTKLYASNEVVKVSFSQVKGKCYVAYSDNIPDGDSTGWSTAGPDRFYFTEAYDSSEAATAEPIRIFTNLGNVGKGGGKGKNIVKKTKVIIPTYPDISRPLRCLDVFAGCGGLSEGLHQSGVAESKWAVEKVDTAAAAFKLNNPDCTVFTDDCNNFLKAVMSGEKKNGLGQTYPQKGDVELLVGGPPCQGFSGMNRFNSREYSKFKNSLIVSYLSFCDYYRPRFFILENVRNFVSFKRSMVLKLTLRCLLKMGYQVTVGVLQAGHYGVPQTRRRAIIMAAAPGEVLPQYPEPRHVFSPKTGGLSIVVDDKKILTGCLFTESAPLRTITVYDSMSDLPEIENGGQKEEMAYGTEAITHFQKLVRDKTEGAKLRDHVCKDMSALVAARMAHVPKTKNADWRDIPNISVQLPDGTYSKKLMYTHHDTKNGKSGTGALRGVCSCASGKKCDPMDRQFNTLIPWCLPHTGNRHNHWAGLYGRLQWGEFFSTTVTNPEPMGKQGRVLHPSQNRVVSVRECARSQGFPDKFKFYGSVLDKHRQVGNAVPPPMGKAIGLEIRRSVSQFDLIQGKPCTTEDPVDST